MQNLDSLSLLYFFQENLNFIQGAIIQKIQLPSRYEVILTIRNLEHKKPQNKKLYININPKYPHVCFADENTLYKRNVIIPDHPPMFCMQLRKYLQGSKIKEFKIVKYERILELYFDYFDEIGSITRLCLALEFMGKHSNIILYNTQNKVILGSIHNISGEKSSVREIYGGIKYIYPPIKQKLDILTVSYSTFYNLAKDNDIDLINNNFYYFSKPILKRIFESTDDKKDIFDFLQKLQNLDNIDFICSFWSEKKPISEAIDKYFSNIMFDEVMLNKKNKLKKLLNSDIKKLNRIVSIEYDTKKEVRYKTFADYIMSNIYSIQPKQKKLILDNLTIPLDENLSASANAQKYYSLYKKALSEKNHIVKRIEQAQNKLEYFNSIIFNIENSYKYEELAEIEEELKDIGLIQNTNKPKKQTIKTQINSLQYKVWEIYIGKNNKQNDFLISKIANTEDLWFHGLNFPSCHIILKVPNDKQNIPNEIIEYCANLVKLNSSAKFSGKTSIIFTKRKNLKKPPNTYPGYVTYKNETEVII